MDTDRIVYQEFYGMKALLTSEPKYMQRLEKLHEYLIELNPDYLCEVDCKFGDNLIKVKRNCWKTQCYGIANHHLYEKYSRVLFKQNGLIDYTFSELKNISGIDLFDTVFISNKQVNYRLFNQLFNLAKRTLVIPTDLVQFDVNKLDKEFDFLERYKVLVFNK